VPLAVITFDFDPLVEIASLTVRWETIAIACAVLLAVVVAAALAFSDRRGRDGPLRRDDMLFILVAIVPAAVVGGRLGYVLIHLDYFRVNPDRILDPSAGGLELGLAVVGGLLAGLVVAALLGLPVGRWLHVAAVPLLLVLGLGKLSNVLGGTGQGEPSVVDWATAYLGPGPWGSLGPEIPSHPAQVYEAAATGVALLVLLATAFVLSPIRRDGRLFFLALGLWAIGRLAAAFWWRDPSAVGPLNAAQLIALGIAIGSIAVLVVIAWRARRWPRPTRPHEGESEDGGTSWPDDEVAGSWRSDP
jgi:phosphatidylglycerol---prolipoprotein diacylglyceryl transferase